MLATFDSKDPQAEITPGESCYGYRGDSKESNPLTFTVYNF